jgi:phenylacetate-coenzyme A ligase PaaK-like adenylate-forming protein
VKYKESQVLQQKRWRLLPNRKNLKIFDQLLAYEFLDTAAQQQQQDHRLISMVQHCARVVPFYQSAFAEREIDLNAIRSLNDLRDFPIIDRAMLQSRQGELKAIALPPNLKFAGTVKTSGSTGQPVEVLHTVNSLNFFGMLKHREYRSWGFDPAKRLAIVRPAVDLPSVEGKVVGKEITIKQPTWQLLGSYFFTGDCLYLADTSGTDFMTRWLNHMKPGYVMAMAAVLEQIALGYADLENTSGLSAALSISQQLTRGMRKLVETHVTSEVHQNYGLNEIGLVAMRCPESGYYHVHNENCLIEIVDDQGRACKPGQTGKLLITGLNNHAMPLLRYDSDDYARVPVEQCPCGRSLQSFTQLRGRYRRTAHLPEGTWDYWGALLDVFDQATADEMCAIKQYQLHQLAADKYYLRLKVVKPIEASLRSSIMGAWGLVDSKPSASLQIFELDRIEQPGKKFQNFISDIAPAAD